MQKDILQEAMGVLTRKRRRRTWKKIVGILACIVVFCTTYALILPALTLEKTPKCGIAAYAHGGMLQAGGSKQDGMLAGKP